MYSLLLDTSHVTLMDSSNWSKVMFNFFDKMDPPLKLKFYRYYTIGLPKFFLVKILKLHGELWAKT